MGQQAKKEEKRSNGIIANIGEARKRNPQYGHDAPLSMRRVVQGVT